MRIRSITCLMDGGFQMSFVLVFMTSEEHGVVESWAGLVPPLARLKASAEITRHHSNKINNKINNEIKYNSSRKLPPQLKQSFRKMEKSNAFDSKSIFCNF